METFFSYSNKNGHQNHIQPNSTACMETNWISAGGAKQYDEFDSMSFNTLFVSHKEIRNSRPNQKEWACCHKLRWNMICLELASHWYASEFFALLILFWNIEKRNFLCDISIVVMYHSFLSKIWNGHISHLHSADAFLCSQQCRVDKQKWIICSFVENAWFRCICLKIDLTREIQHISPQSWLKLELNTFVQTIKIHRNKSYAAK